MTARRIEGNFNQGWGVAGLITLLVVAAFVIAFTVNRRTHYSPNDVLAPTAGAPATPAPAKTH
jgi:hypothetical protein